MEKALLTEVKAILKSLVLSCPEKMTVEQLNRDYRNVEGQFIPYRQLGYGNLEQFLRSVPDTLRVFGTGPAAMVCFVANEKSDHIHDMIMRQKKPKTKARSTFVSHNRNNEFQRSNRINTNTHQPVKVAWQQLSGYQSVERNYMTDTGQVKNAHNFAQTVNPVAMLLANQMSCTLPQANGILFNIQHYNAILSSVVQNGIVNSIAAIQAQAYERQNNYFTKTQCNVTNSPPQLPRQQNESVRLSSEKISVQVLGNTKKDSPKEVSTDVLKSTEYYSTENAISPNEIKTPTAKKQIQAQAYKRQNKYFMKGQGNVTNPPPQLPRQQNACFRLSSEKIPSVQVLGNPKKDSPREGLTDVPKSAKYFSTGTTISTNETNTPTDKNQIPIQLSEDVEKNLLTIPKINKDKNPMRESSTNEGVKEVQKEENIQNANLANETKTTQSKRFFDDTADRVQDVDEAVPAFAAKYVFRLDFPEHTVLYGNKIAPYKLSDEITVGSYVKLFISEIHNPFKFWFHIHKDNHELDLLMSQIERYYSILEPEDLRIPIICLTPSQVCAACYNGLWHRAEIVGPVVSKNIKVLFMDYGTVADVQIENIKFLQSFFAQLPAQALRGCLSHIKPRDRYWCHEATTYFLTLVAELMLYAKITEIDRKKNILYMILCDTNGEEVIQINTSLVESRYAYYNEEWKTERIEQVFYFQSLFLKTFSMIESGEYPSFPELVSLEQRGIDYEAIYDTITTTSRLY